MLCSLFSCSCFSRESADSHTPCVDSSRFELVLLSYPTPFGYLPTCIPTLKFRGPQQPSKLIVFFLSFLFSLLSFLNFLLEISLRSGWRSRPRPYSIISRLLWKHRLWCTLPGDFLTTKLKLKQIKTNILRDYQDPEIILYHLFWG